jgi:hypothetical protein
MSVACEHIVCNWSIDLPGEPFGIGVAAAFHMGKARAGGSSRVDLILRCVDNNEARITINQVRFFIVTHPLSLVFVYGAAADVDGVGSE